LNDHLDGGIVACDIREDRADELVVDHLAVAGVGKQKHTIRFVAVLDGTDVLGSPKKLNREPSLETRYFSNVFADQRKHLAMEGMVERG